MTDRRNQIGFSQRIRLEWFEQTANLILAGNSRTTIEDALQTLLQDKVSSHSHAVRGAREKVISILLKTWLTVPSGLEALRDEGLDILPRLSRKDRVAVHWGMALAVYPFWGVVATYTGRLLRLQGLAASTQIQRRVKEQYGERETASRAARRVLRTFVDWGVLIDTPQRGIYAQGEQYEIQDPMLVVWMLEACLRSHVSRSTVIRDLLRSPSTFPFLISYSSAENRVAHASRLDILYQGTNSAQVFLRDQASGPPVRRDVSV